MSGVYRIVASLVLLLKCKGGASLGCDVSGGETVELEKLGNLTALAEFILYTHSNNGNGTGLCQSFAYCGTETADDAVLLCSYYRTSLGCVSGKKLLIDRLDGMYIDNK